MDKIKALFNSPEHVKGYDLKTRKANWLGPEILFGLCFRDIWPGEKILDMGIGTGLISELFHKAGLEVYGMDFSSGMLKACAEKGIAVELKEHDLRNIPYPYATDSMEHAVCGGVMHIFEDISPIFKEVSRITRKNGIFAFACVDHNASCTGKTPIKSGQMTAMIYSHEQAAIEKLLELYHFELLNSLEFSVYMQGNKNHRHSFQAYTVRNLKVK